MPAISGNATLLMSTMSKLMKGWLGSITQFWRHPVERQLPQLVRTPADLAPILRAVTMLHRIVPTIFSSNAEVIDQSGRPTRIVYLRSWKLSRDKKTDDQCVLNGDKRHVVLIREQFFKP